VEAAVARTGDRFGLGWRPELAAAIHAHADRIDLVEVIADDWLGAGRERLRALGTLGAQLPVVLHGVGLGLASSAPVAGARLDAFARVVDAARPAAWSEHLAFVRADGVELGHLAAPPRCAETLEGLAANVERATEAIGARPQLENVATLYDPPGSDRDELEFVAGALDASGGDLLLDLHNLHANATNFGFDARAFLRELPAERIASVHLAGGHFVRDGTSGTSRLLDDHLHDVPDSVFDLLEEVGRLAPRPLDVILERDGRYPPIASLLAELDRARAALAAGRARRPSEPDTPHARSGAAVPVEWATGVRRMPGAVAESWLGRVLTAPPDAAAPDAAQHQVPFDAGGLALAAASFRKKRARRSAVRHAPPQRGWTARIAARLRGA
jgi:uncharacterized protein (UPF0276 family)